MYNAPGNAIYLHGNDHKIEYDEVYGVMMDGDDQGAYYLGWDPSEFNNEVTWTINYDDGVYGNLAYSNAFYKAVKEGAAF